MIQSTDYYPFGMRMKNHFQRPTNGIMPVRYGLSGNEEEPALELMDFNARWYDPALGKFLNVDPMAEKMPEWGIYRYALNNPISITDATGMMPDGWSEGNMQLAGMFGVFGNGAGNDVDYFYNQDPPTGGGDPIKGTPPNEGLGLAIFSMGTATLSSSIGYSARIQIKTPKIGISPIKQMYGSGGVLAKNMLNTLGGVTSAIGFVDNVSKTISGEYNYTRGGIEIGMNIVSALGVPGAALGVGWELGRSISNNSSYRENVRPRLQEFFNIRQDEYIRCATCGGNGWVKIK